MNEIFISNANELNKIFQAILSTYSELPLENVRNGASLRGEDLGKIMQKISVTDPSKRKTYSVIDSFLIFELSTRTDGVNITTTEEDLEETVRSYSSFSLSISIYGNSAINVATKLRARLFTEKVRMVLHEKGVHLEGISQIQTLNEFKSETLWKRCSFNIDFSCIMEYSQIEAMDEFEEYSKINIIK